MTPQTEAQFEVRQACSRAPRPQRALQSLLDREGSFALWVEFPGRAPNFARQESDCGAAKVFRVMPKSRDWLLDQLGVPAIQRDFVVCEHMGSIIE